MMTEHFLLWRRKSIWLLLLAAWSIALTGLSLGEFHWKELGAVLWVTWTLIAFVYGVDTLVDHQNLSEVIVSKNGLKLLALLFSGAAMAVILGPISMMAMGLILFIGLFYTVPFPTGRGVFRVKNITGIKGLLIGFGWALLIYVGSGVFPSLEGMWTAVFVGVQVVIGSTLRDLDDLEEDRIHRVKTLPLVIGENNCYILLHLLNLLTGVLALFSPLPWALWWLGVIIWRSATLEWLRLGNPGHYATQYMNLATCAWILILRLVPNVMA